MATKDTANYLLEKLFVRHCHRHLWYANIQQTIMLAYIVRTHIAIHIIWALSIGCYYGIFGLFVQRSRTKYNATVYTIDARI